MKPQDFINAVKDAAITADRQYGIPASLTIAQAILESGWGASGLASAYYNLFGIKATPSWTGRSVNLNTKEYRNGAYEDTKDWFRAYDSWAGSIADHTKVLLQDRYAPVRAAKDYKGACKQIQACGYATSPIYADSLIRLIDRYNLNQYDVQASAAQPTTSKPIQTPVDTSSYYTVKSGDTLTGIAAKYLGSAIKYKDLASLNHLPDPNKIYPGEKIYLKAAAPAKPVSHTYYTVKSGDVLTRIAQKLLGSASKYKDIAALNHLADPNKIYPGQKLLIK